MLNEVIIQQSVFELIHRAACLCREFFEPDPHQKSTANMIALDTCLTALTAFQPRHLFAFGMRPEDGLTDWALLVTERSPLTIVHVAEPTAGAVAEWDWEVHLP